MSWDTANRFISVASRLNDIPQIAEFKPSTLYELAKPSTPDSVIEQASLNIREILSIAFNPGQIIRVIVSSPVPELFR